MQEPVKVETSKNLKSLGAISLNEIYQPAAVSFVVIKKARDKYFATTKKLICRDYLNEIFVAGVHRKNPSPVYGFKYHHKDHLMNSRLRLVVNNSIKPSSSLFSMNPQLDQAEVARILKDTCEISVEVLNEVERLIGIKRAPTRATPCIYDGKECFMLSLPNFWTLSPHRMSMATLFIRVSEFLAYYNLTADDMFKAQKLKELNSKYTEYQYKISGPTTKEKWLKANKIPIQMSHTDITVLFKLKNYGVAADIAKDSLIRQYFINKARKIDVNAPGQVTQFHNNSGILWALDNLARIRGDVK